MPAFLTDRERSWFAETRFGDREFLDIMEIHR